MLVMSVSSVSVFVLKSNPVKLAVQAHGLSSTPGWTNVRLSAEGDRDPFDDILQLTLEGDPPPPDSVVPQVVTPVSASLVYDGRDSERLNVVKVSARLGAIASHAEQWGIPSPSPEPARESSSLAALAASGLTTLAVGEENPPTTFPRGEESLPTTFAVGEEGPPTTLLRGEEGVPTTLRLGEEHQPTTILRGEEGFPTTLILGEEGSPTTGLQGEEGPTTERFGEEGPITSPLVDDPTFPGAEDPGIGGGSFGGGGPFGGF